MQSYTAPKASSDVGHRGHSTRESAAAGSEGRPAGHKARTKSTLGVLMQRAQTKRRGVIIGSSTRSVVSFPRPQDDLASHLERKTLHRSQIGTLGLACVCRDRKERRLGSKRTCVRAWRPRRGASWRWGAAVRACLRLCWKGGGERRQGGVQGSGNRAAFGTRGWERRGQDL